MNAAGVTFKAGTPTPRNADTECSCIPIGLSKYNNIPCLYVFHPNTSELSFCKAQQRIAWGAQYGQAYS